MSERQAGALSQAGDFKQLKIMRATWAYSTGSNLLAWSPPRTHPQPPHHQRVKPMAAIQKFLSSLHFLASRLILTSGRTSGSWAFLLLSMVRKMESVMCSMGVQEGAVGRGEGRESAGGAVAS